MAQYEVKVAKLEDKHKTEAEEYQVRLQQLKDKLLSETETRTMLDDNLRVLSRRMNDIEIEHADTKDKNRTLERANANFQAEIDGMYEQQTQIRTELERTMRQRFDDKEKELRRAKEDAQNKQHKADS